VVGGFDAAADPMRVEGTLRRGGDGVSGSGRRGISGAGSGAVVHDRMLRT